MRPIRVDERDSTGERVDPRVRSWVFDCIDGTVTTVDILDATVEQALEKAPKLYLWSASPLLSLLRAMGCGRGGWHTSCSILSGVTPGYAH